MPSDLQVALQCIRNRVAYLGPRRPAGPHRDGFIEGLEIAAAIIEGIQSTAPNCAGHHIPTRNAAEEIQVHGTFTLNLLPDGRHVNLALTFPEMPAEIQEWLKFTYCNDLVWRNHASFGAVQWFSMVRLDLYRHLFRHVHGEQFLAAE